MEILLLMVSVNSKINSSKSNHLNTSNIDNIIGNSNFPRFNIQTKSSFYKPTTFKKETDTQSSIIINYEIIDENNISEEISSHSNSEEVIDHAFDDNGKSYPILF